MIKILYKLILVFLSLAAFSVAQAQTNHDYLIYVSKTFDDYATHLNGFYSQFWIKQAPLLKESTIKQLKSSALCEKNNYGSLILNMEPHLFYNPLMGKFYGSIKTTVYSSQPKPIKNFLSEDEIEGRLDVLPERNIGLLFDRLILKLQNQLKNDSSINEYLNKKNTVPIDGAFCLLFN
jgi:hypothetical protein